MEESGLTEGTPAIQSICLEGLSKTIKIFNLDRRRPGRDPNRAPLEYRVMPCTMLGNCVNIHLKGPR